MSDSGSSRNLAQASEALTHPEAEGNADALLLAAKAVLNGPFEREDSEFADALFEELRQAVAAAEGAR